MPIRYTRVGWQDAPSTETPIDAANLNHMDNGILAISEELDTELDTIRDEFDTLEEDTSAQISKFSSDITDMQNSLPGMVSSWLTEHVNPAGSAVTLDNTLTVEGSAADSKAVGDALKARNIWTGYCESNHDEQTKIVTLDNPVGFSLSTNTIILVRFRSYNSADNPKLSIVNFESADTIMIPYSPSSGMSIDYTNPEFKWANNSVVAFIRWSDNWWFYSVPAYGYYLMTTLYAKRDSPAFTGMPTAPTPGSGTNSTRIATTAFVANELSPVKNALQKKAPIITDTASGNIVSFSDGADGVPMESVVVTIEPVQSGSGDPSPTNVRPISGWSAVEVTRAGKNLLKPKFYTNLTYNASVGASAGAPYVISTVTDNGDGTYSKTSASAWSQASFVQPIKPGVTYKLSGTISTPSAAVCAYLTDEDYTIIRILNTNSYSVSDLSIISSWTTADNEVYLCLLIATRSAGDIVITKPMLEVGSSASTYEAYVTPQTATLTLPSTVYGGTLDVVSGVLTITDGYISSYAGETLPSTWISDRDVHAEGTTPTTGAQVVYTLAESQTVQLSPQEVDSLLGQNNVWSDAGTVSVVYKADTKRFILKAIADAMP